MRCAALTRHVAVRTGRAHRWFSFADEWTQLPFVERSRSPQLPPSRAGLRACHEFPYVAVIRRPCDSAARQVRADLLGCPHGHRVELPRLQHPHLHRAGSLQRTCSQPYRMASKYCERVVRCAALLCVAHRRRVGGRECIELRLALPHGTAHARKRKAHFVSKVLRRVLLMPLDAPAS